MYSVRSKLTIKGFIGGVFRRFRGLRLGGAWLRLGRRVFVAEEGVIEVVDSVVDSGDLSTHFLAECGDIGAQILAERTQVLALDTK